MKKHKKLWIFLGILIVIFVCLAFLLRRPAGTVPGNEIQWGVAFSKYFTEKMSLDWKETYLAILDDLKPKTLRLPIYWNDIEPQSGQYEFTDYDWMVGEAQKHDVKLILVIGRKLPRWPECHVPGWAAPLNLESQKTMLLKMLPQIVNRYKNLTNLYLWQVENEPFLPFGECPLAGSEFLTKEIDLVRSFDLKHKILVTDSGEISPWLQAANYGDVFGTTMYRVVWNQFLGYFKYPLPPQFFWLKANLVHLLHPKKPIIVSELQGETWGHKMPYETAIEEQFKSINIEQFKENIAYARQVGFPEVSLWGAEWWYWLKTKNNHPEFWEEAKSLINE
jgi:hypothetical protein